MKDYEKAIADYDEAIRLNSNYANAYYNRGVAHFNLGKKDKALADWKEAGKIYQQLEQEKDYQHVDKLIKKYQ